ncbi:MAG: NrfD/PsrC family molybdoenzyme membrane anchor subunit [Acidimicrobiales bacterium]
MIEQQTISKAHPVGSWLTPWRVVGLVLWLVLLVVGIQGLYDRLAFGSRLTDLGSYYPWGLWVSSYIWFVGLSAGAFLLSTLVYVFGMRQLERIGSLALVVALVTLIMALLTIWFDIGHMSRFVEVYYRGNPHSAMAWMVWLYTAYFLLLVSETYFVVRGRLIGARDARGLPGITARLLTGRHEAGLSETEGESHRDQRIVRVLGAIGIPLAIAFHGGVGALFATPVARGVWHSSLYPILFLVGAFFSGGALLTAIVGFFWPNRDDEWRRSMQMLGRITLGLLLLEALLDWADLSVPLWYGIGRDVGALHSMLYGGGWWVFWLLQVGLGLVVPAGLLLWGRKSPLAISLAGAVIAVTFIATRIDLVLPGFKTPELPNLQYSYHSGRLLYYYVPTWSEWELIAFMIAFGIALYVLLTRALPVLGKGEAR